MQQLDDLIPTEKWELQDWLDAVGARHRTIVVDQAVQLGITEFDKPWNPKRIYDWNESGITDRKLALAMITVLREIARLNHIGIFTNERIEDHATIFLRSKACKHQFAPPNNDDLWDICKERIDSNMQEANELLSKVHPRPPLKLFGRNHDIKRVLDGLDNRLITMIDGVGGEGKTALAWFSAMEAVQSGRFTQFDWSTDKRSLIRASGKEVNLDTRRLNLELILRSMVSRFEWKDLRGKQGETLAIQCAEKLRAGRYLIVIDNLETVEDSEEIVRDLLDMLQPRRTNEPPSSKILITSRKSIKDYADCQNVLIKGIGEDARIPYIQFLIQSWYDELFLTDKQYENIATVTHGNPLVMQAAVQKLMIAPIESREAIVQEMFAESSNTLFAWLFASNLGQLTPITLELATQAAVEATVSYTNIHYEDLRQAYEMFKKEGHLEVTQTFIEVMESLVNNHILSPGTANEYSMHPLIRAYLVNRLPK